jgi:hypothetical protein
LRAALNALRGEKDRRDRGDERRELARFGGELPATFRGDRIELGPSPLVCDAPFGDEPSVAFHSVKGGIKGAFFDAHDVVRTFGDPAQNAEAVSRLEGERFEDEGVEDAVESVGGGHGSGVWLS